MQRASSDHPATSSMSNAQKIVSINRLKSGTTMSNKKITIMSRARVKNCCNFPVMTIDIDMSTIFPTSVTKRSTMPPSPPSFKDICSITK